MIGVGAGFEMLGMCWSSGLSWVLDANLSGVGGVLETLGTCWSNIGWALVDHECKSVYWTSAGAVGMYWRSMGLAILATGLVGWSSVEVVLEALGTWWSNTG